VLVSLWIMGLLFILYFSFSFPAVLQVYCPKLIDKWIERNKKKIK